jgi:hypothetical protein
MFRRFFDPSTNRWFRVFDRIRTGEPGRLQIFGKKTQNRETSGDEKYFKTLKEPPVLLGFFSC